MMIDYDHLWWIKSTYDGWRRLKTSFRSVGGLFGPLCQPINLKIRPGRVFTWRVWLSCSRTSKYHSTSKNKERTWFLKIGFSKSMNNWSDHIHQVQFFMLNSNLDSEPDFNRIRKVKIHMNLHDDDDDDIWWWFASASCAIVTGLCQSLSRSLLLRVWFVETPALPPSREPAWN